MLKFSSGPNLTFYEFKTKNNRGFTIVELIVVIVVIGILAAITTVSYTNITKKATEAGLVSNLDGAKKQLELYKVEHGTYPTTVDENKCPTAPANDPKYCLKPSVGTSLSFSAGANGMTYGLRATNGPLIYAVSDTKSPTPTVNIGDGTNWITIGSQTWAKANLNVGTMITGVATQTNNATIEKYCYGNATSSCITYGGLYQWDEAMQYSTTEGAQGICPASSHIPSDNDWKILEVQLGMTQAQADAEGVWRGTNQGSQLKFGGSSELNVPLAGSRGITGGSFVGPLMGYQWSSSVSSTYSWGRILFSDNTAIYRNLNSKNFGFSVRCLGN